MRWVGTLGLLALVLAPGASAAISPVVADCNSHATLTRSYSVAELRAALAGMPADVKEYTNCYDLIQRALLTKVGSVHAAGGSKGGSGGSILPVWLIVLLAVLLLGGGGAALAASRRQ